MFGVLNKKEGDRPIRRVLRHKHTEEYFTGYGWSKNPEEARTFADSVEAAQACAHCALSEMEIVLRVRGGTSDLFCTELC